MSVNPALVDGAIALALAGAVWMLYGAVRYLWWTHDDFFFLRFLITGRPFSYFSDASTLPGIMAPVLLFSLDLDRRLFGLDPRPFYVHQLVGLSVCAAALYGAARLWLARPWSVVAVWVFLIGPVTGSLASLLMVRHYVAAVALSALSVLTWALALRSFPGWRAWGLARLSAALYVAASVSKEIAVPLALLLPLLPAPGVSRVGLGDRVRLAVPHALGFAGYLTFRYAVLWTLGGGYGFAVRAVDLPVLALELPGKIASELLGGRPSAAAIVFGLTLVAGVAGLVSPPRSGRAALLVGVALVLAMLPVLPVSTRIEPRYAAPVWIVVAVAFAAGCGKLAAAGVQTKRVVAVAIAVVASVSGLLLNREDWRVRFAGSERVSAENRFVLDMREGDVLSRPLMVAASLDELVWMKEAVYGRPRGGGWFQDDLFLCRHPESLGRVWGYDAGARRVVEITAQIPARRDRHCAAIQPEASLTASFRVAGTDLFWELGPYRVGRYRFVLRDGVAAFDIPRSAGFQMGGQHALTLRIGYESPEGWITYSPELDLRFVDGWSLSWSRTPS